MPGEQSYSTARWSQRRRNESGHNRLRFAVLKTLERALHGSNLADEVFADGMMVPIEPHTAYEPGALLRLGPVLSNDQVIVVDPVIVAEVLSPAMAHTDTSAKLIGYFKLASVEHYLVIDPDARTLTRHARATAGALSSATLASGVLGLQPPGLEIDVGGLFADVA